MPPRDDTRRWTVTGPAGRAGTALARRAPRSLGRSAAGTGQAMVRRRLLESLPYPENLDHHFVVDPTKFDFYAMDCYRTLGVNAMAETRADEVIQASTDFDGRERAPMRLTEARITLGVVKAREGDLEGAVDLGMRALSGDRKSLPSLLMVSRDLTRAKGGLQ